MNSKLNDYYFTYGDTESQAFKNGYSIIKAKDMLLAKEIHMKHYGVTKERLGKWAACYTEKEFKEFFPEGLNRGKGCHETIS